MLLILAPAPLFLFIASQKQNLERSQFRRESCATWKRSFSYTTYMQITKSMQISDEDNYQ